MLKYLAFSIFIVGMFLWFEVLKILKKIAFSIFNTFDENTLTPPVAIVFFIIFLKKVIFLQYFHNKF